jgi:hypothetical protein
VKTGGAAYVGGTPYDGTPLNAAAGAWGGALTAIGPFGGERHSHSAGPAYTTGADAGT